MIRKPLYLRRMRPPRYACARARAGIRVAVGGVSTHRLQNLISPETDLAAPNPASQSRGLCPRRRQQRAAAGGSAHSRLNNACREPRPILNSVDTRNSRCRPGIPGAGPDGDKRALRCLPFRVLQARNRPTTQITETIRPPDNDTSI